MEQGTVKWFNAEKDLASFHVKTVQTYLYISQQSKVKASRL